MTRAKPRFKPGELVWISTRVDDWHAIATKQTVKDYPDLVKIEPGKPCTIIRRALAKDYGKWARDMRGGKSYALRRAEKSWLVLYDGIPAMIEEAWLSKRYYKPRKRKE
jgi:hypothetical protein